MSSRPSSSSFVIPAIFGSWSTMPAERDLEAQVVVGAHERLPETRLPTPPSAFIHAPRTQPSPAGADEEATDLADDFFGVARSPRTSPVLLRGTQDSRHDALSPPTHHDAHDVPPPPYSSSADPPAYSRSAEHPTLAMYLFKFGFLFPLFWLAGALILVSPLHAPDDWERGKTEAERRALLETMRRTEVKWAGRCLTALLLFALAVVVIVFAAVFALRARA